MKNLSRIKNKLFLFTFFSNTMPKKKKRGNIGRSSSDTKRKKEERKNETEDQTALRLQKRADSYR